MPWNQGGFNNNNNQPSNYQWNPENNNNNQPQPPASYPFNNPGNSSQPTENNNQPTENNNQPIENAGNTNQANSIEDDYMKKLNVVNTCPEEVRNKQAGKEYPTPQKITYHSTTTETDRQMNVVLPLDYSEDKKYPVLYYLHGIMGDEDSMLDEGAGAIAIQTNLLNEGKAKDMIIVFPNEYAPAPGTEVPADFTPEYFSGYDNFLNELVNDIMPYMEEHYSIATGKDNTALCGFSMGGRNTLYIGYKRSDLFGYIGAFSPAPGVTPGDDTSGHHPGLFTEEEFRSDNPPFVTLISCGTNDSAVGEFPKSYHEILTKNNQQHIWFEIPGADHDNNAISAGYYNFIQTAFGALAD